MCKQEGNNEKKEMQDKEMQKKLELQLHEQYAINNNSNLSSALVLFVAMLAVVSAYGYVFVRTDYGIENSTSTMVYNDKFTYNALLLTAAATIFVLSLIVYLCISFGCKQRREQFIIYAIRRKYYNKEDYDKIFPKGYNPFDKHGLEKVQSPYDKFIYCVIAIVVAILLSTLLKVTECNIIKYILLFAFILDITLLCILFCIEKCKIDDLEEHYKEICIKEEGKKQEKCCFKVFINYFFGKCRKTNSTAANS